MPLLVFKSMFIPPEIKTAFDDGLLHKMIYGAVVFFSKFLSPQTAGFPLYNNYGFKTL
jgi:hypothetical protein